MSDQAYAKVQVQQKTLPGSSPRSSLLQRTCTCGQHTNAGSECSSCREQSMLLRSQRAFEPSSSPVAIQDNSLAQENVTSLNSAAFDRASRFGHDFTGIPNHSIPNLSTHRKQFPLTMENHLISVGSRSIVYADMPNSAFKKLPYSLQMA
jgi:hypothetical protein